MASSSSSSDSSDSECNSSGYEVDIFGESQGELQPLGLIQPWRYEPQGTSHDSSHEEPVDTDEDHDHSDRLDNTDWYRQLAYKY